VKTLKFVQKTVVAVVFLNFILIYVLVTSFVHFFRFSAPFNFVNKFVEPNWASKMRFSFQIVNIKELLGG